MRPRSTIAKYKANSMRLILPCTMNSRRKPRTPDPLIPFSHFVLEVSLEPYVTGGSNVGVAVKGRHPNSYGGPSEPAPAVRHHLRRGVHLPRRRGRSRRRVHPLRPAGRRPAGRGLRPRRGLARTAAPPVA